MVVDVMVGWASFTSTRPLLDRDSWPEALPDAAGVPATRRCAARLTFHPLVPASKPPLTTNSAPATALWLTCFAVGSIMVTAKVAGTPSVTRQTVTTASRLCLGRSRELDGWPEDRCRPLLGVGRDRRWGEGPLVALCRGVCEWCSAVMLPSARGEYG